MTAGHWLQYPPIPTSPRPSLASHLLQNGRPSLRLQLTIRHAHTHTHTHRERERERQAEKQLAEDASQGSLSMKNGHKPEDGKLSPRLWADLIPWSKENRCEVQTNITDIGFDKGNQVV